MLYFFDTSALVKRYHPETGSPIVNEIFDNAENQIVIANLSLSEFVSALHRIRRRGLMNQTDFEITLEGFKRDVAVGRIGIIAIQDSHILRSYELIIQYHLTAADAIILTTAIEIKELGPVFVCADVNSGLLDAAQACHISTLNPLSA